MGATNKDSARAEPASGPTVELERLLTGWQDRIVARRETRDEREREI